MDELHKFLITASAATYAGGGEYEQKVERPGFYEMKFVEGDWFYRDSYTGLKKAILAKPEGFSARGPENFSEGDWRYEYTQHGKISDFHGHEQIFYRNELVFWHWVIGGIIVDKK